MVLFDRNRNFGAKKTIGGNKVLKPKSLLVAQRSVDGRTSDYSSFEDGFPTSSPQKQSPTAGFFSEQKLSPIDGVKGVSEAGYVAERVLGRYKKSFKSYKKYFN